MTSSKFSTGTDKSTHKGGYSWMLSHLDSAPHTYLDLINHEIELTALPYSERNLFWHGQLDALHDGLARRETAMQMEATITPDDAEPASEVAA